MMDEVFEDYKLEIIEGIPIKTTSNGILCKPKEITREDLLKAIGNETFAEVIKFEDEKEVLKTMWIECIDKKTGDKRYFKIYWKHILYFFEG